MMGAVTSNGPALKLKVLLKFFFYVFVVVVSRKCVYLLLYELAHTPRNASDLSKYDLFHYLIHQTTKNSLAAKY
jgi:hypothetical protein